MASQLFAKKSIDKLIADSENPETRLKKTLGPVALTSLGIGAVIGSGIFTVVGTAIRGEQFSTQSLLHAPVLEYLIHGSATFGRPGAGPSIALSFVLVAIACAFAALCYAEMASMIPIAGSAYTYTYATMGELIAWIIGWDLILEYAVSNMAVGVGFSAHIVNLLDLFGIHLPAYLIAPTFLAAPEGFKYNGAFNLPAFLIVMFLTVILVRGIKESAETNNIMVLLKLAAIFAFVIAGSAYVSSDNWTPFMPNGWAGLLTGGSIVFFTYIGFDSVSTAAEEAKDPQRTVPIGIIATLIICTILYISVVVVLTGMEKWNLLDPAAPVVEVLKKYNLGWVRAGVLFGAIMGMISSLLVFQIGQARVWYAMSRDGLLPKMFSAVHPKFRTPHISTWIAGVLVGLGGGLLDIGSLANLSNLGTLFAFTLVALGLLILRRRDAGRTRGFRAPGGPVAPVATVLMCALLMGGLTIMNWIAFLAWLVIGLVIYFGYSQKHSEFAS
jgi:basic amino acid/polyamine antiporter, APA family